jgi:hypothetical protein
MKLKMHHILILVLVVFISGISISAFLKVFIKEQNRIKSEITNEELLGMVEPGAIEYAKSLNPELDLNKIVSADFFFFKNKREIAVVLSDGTKDYLLKLVFKNLSPGYGLRAKLNELTPAEGIYSVDYSGYLKKGGLFVRVLYPPESYKNYQRLNYEALKLEPYLISEKPLSYSFIQTENDFMKLFVYLILKLDQDKVRLLIYPDRPPLEMEIGGTEFVSELYQNLEKEYIKLNDLIESLKPKF